MQEKQKNKDLIPLSINVPVDRIKMIYENLKPLTWVTNFRNGKSTSSNKLRSFLDIPAYERWGIKKEDLDFYSSDTHCLCKKLLNECTNKCIDKTRAWLDEQELEGEGKGRNNIVAFRFLVDQNKYTLTRKIDKDYIDGFFYHIKEGRSTILGKLGLDVPYFAERVGFCYDLLGNATTIRVDHSGYLREVEKRIKEIEQILMVPPTLQVNNAVKERYKNKIIRILNKNITYKMNVEIYHENIIDKRVNVSLFGSLDILPSEPVSLPRVYENTSEVVIKSAF